MAVKEIKEGLENPKIPLIGEIGSATAIVAVIAGLVLMNLLEPFSESIADRISAFIQSMTGFSLQEGQTQQTGGAFD